MRIKALLCAAALAAGAVSSMAQSNVYSLNIVGYVNVPMIAGFNLIANPLDNGTNDFNSLFANASFGDTIFVWNATAAKFDSSVFVGSWGPDLITTPGQGVFYQASAAFTNTFVGNVLTGNLSNHIPAGFSIVSSQVPQADNLDNLGLVGGFGDTVFFWNPSKNGYDSSVYVGTWSSPVVNVGQSFWYQAGAALNWNRTFNP
jgi:hypothetical protein